MPATKQHPNTPHDPPRAKRYLNTEEAAAFLGIMPSTLRWWRFKRRGPEYYKPAGSKTILYTEACLTAYMEKSRIKL